MSETGITSLAVIVSGTGRGSNLVSLIEACTKGQIPAQVALVIGTRADAPALERAREAGIATSVVSPRKYEGDDPGYAKVLSRLLHRHGIELVCLAGSMRQLPPQLVTEFSGKILNIHPSLLPHFGGKGMFGERVHEAVLASGAILSGCTVHFVDEGYDTGAIVLQRTVSVFPDDTPQSLGARVLKEEHLAYAEAVKMFCLGEIGHAA